MNIPEMTDDEVNLIYKNWLDAPRHANELDLIRMAVAARDAQYAAMAGQEPVGWEAVVRSVKQEAEVALVIGDDVGMEDALTQILKECDALVLAPTNPAAQEPVGAVEHCEFTAARVQFRVTMWTDQRVPGRTLLYTHPYVQSELDAAAERARDLVAGLNIEDVPAAQERAEPVAPAVGEAKP